MIHMQIRKMERGDVKETLSRKKYRDTLKKQVKATVDTISPCSGDDFT